ncbi:hypothetical protein MPSEU_000634300 [Mayamaea pseudoterrestris]|nr:hypothetical protein MPSEU_000634300 [Mayamaea pseudoterrestris]
MSSDDEDDLFGGSDSDDTAELLAASSSTKGRLSKGPPSAVKKKPLQKPKKTTPTKKALKKKDSDDEGDGGLFDSSSDEDEPEDSKPKALSKKERLQALAARKRGTIEGSGRTTSSGSLQKKKQAGASGYDSEDSYESATYERTVEDDDFLDTTGEDADAVAELYAEQHFGDEWAHQMTSKKKGSKRSHDDDDRPDRVHVDPNKEPDNPIMAAVYRMKKKSRTKKTFTEMEDECKLFLGRMEQAAADDEDCFAAKKPATHKLSMLSEVNTMLARKDIQRMLIDMDLLVLVKRWIQPLPNGQLGNLTVRQRLLDAMATMVGESGINGNDLKSSELGKTVMVLYKHKDETATMKNGILRKLIEQWSRPIFQKSANHRDLERVNARGDRGLSALSRQQHYATKMQERDQKATHKTAADTKHRNLQSIIRGDASNKGGTLVASAARVSVPFSKGFQYTVRPEAKAATPEKGGATRQLPDTRHKLNKKMQEKTRTVSKNNRSANVSVEGRVVK